MPAVSIIIAAYNAESWITAAVESVVCQSETDWELVVVDDGSIDATGSLCMALAGQDKRIRCLRRDNGGLSCARNSGLDVAGGEWISFLDADDLLHPRFLEIMLAAAKATSADLVTCEARDFSEGDPFRTDSLQECRYKIHSPVEAVRGMLYQRGGVRNSAWGKLYRRELWKDMRFTDGLYYEDLDIMYRIMDKCERICEVEERLYGYRHHPGSYLHRFTRSRLDVLTATERMEAWIAAHRPELLPAARDRRMSACFNIFLLAERARGGEEFSEDDIDSIQEEMLRRDPQATAESLTGAGVRLRNRPGAAVSYLGPELLRKLNRFL